MKRLFNESFLHFVLGFAGMLTLSLSLTFFIEYYDGSQEVQTAAADAH